MPASDAAPRKQLTAGGVIAATLSAHGIDRVFCVPGESYLGLLDGLYDHPEIDVVTCRHEGSAGFMAVADARLSGRPGILCVSRGPGASNASIAIHTAQQDAVPLILFVGQVALADLRRGAFQEIDYGRMFGGIAKWTFEVTDPDQIGEVMTRAWRAATTGVPGPVVIAVPEDVLTAPTRSAGILPQPPVVAAPPPEAAERLAAWIKAAERPLVIAGHGLDCEGGREALLAFAERRQVPVAVSFRRHDLFPNTYPLFAGDLGLANSAAQMEVFRNADLVIALGTRLGDITTQGYTYPEMGPPARRLVHVYDDADFLGCHFTTELAIACPPAALLAALPAPRGEAPDRNAWIAELQSVRARGTDETPVDQPDGVPFEHVVQAVGAALKLDAIVTVDAGTFGAPVYRAIPFQPPQRLLAPISGAMGFGIPAAVAAALRFPDRQIVCFVGDGGFLMMSSELAVAAERKLPIKIIVSENHSYGSIRIHQERDYPGRTVGTTLFNPDISKMGEAYGFNVTDAESVAQIGAVVDAIGAEGPQFVRVETSLLAVLPGDGGAI